MNIPSEENWKVARSENSSEEKSLVRRDYSRCDFSMGVPRVFQLLLQKPVLRKAKSEWKHFKCKNVGALRKYLRF